VLEDGAIGKELKNGITTGLAVGLACSLTEAWRK
jgi:hypothetical protein